jgi:hypothetical protein
MPAIRFQVTTWRERGDTLRVIVARFDTSVHDLATAKGKTYLDFISAVQKIYW